MPSPKERNGRAADSRDEGVWLLVQAKPGRERLAEEHLRRQRFATFVPKIMRTRRYRGGARTERCALFPSYLFVHVDTDGSRWQAIGNTLGIQRLVSFGSEGPARVPPALIELLMERCDSNGVISPTPLQIGDRVRVVSGPFAELMATVDSMPSSKRVWILLDILGRQSKVSVAAVEVERE